MIRSRQLLLACLLLCLVATPISAIDHVIINSRDWRDVYSATLYGHLLDVPSNFLVSSRHSQILLASLPTSHEEIYVFSSEQNPFQIGYEGILEQRGYDNPQEFIHDDINLAIARRINDDIADVNAERGSSLEPITKFILLDDAYGYNALSVASYAVVGRYYVLFVNDLNVDDVVDFLEDATIDELIVYGQVDRDVKDAVAPFDPEFLNIGNRFENNIEIVKRYLEIKPRRQAVLTNGEFIENSLVSGDDPVLFIGRANVPDEVRNYIKSSEIDIGILVGNELVGAATTVRRQLGISVFVKFAQSARQPVGAISKVEDLDRFPMPGYDLSLDIASIVYNEATGALEVTYQNNVGLGTYFLSTITITDDTGTKIVGDADPIFIEGDALKTIVYTETSNGDPLNLQGDELSGRVFTIYGESPRSLEFTLDRAFTIEKVSVEDDTDIEIRDLVYDAGDQAFIVTIENTGDVDAYVNPEVVDVIVNDERVTAGAIEVTMIEPGADAKIPIPIEMVEEDFAENPTVRVRAYYGARRLSLIKVKSADFEFRLAKGGLLIYVLVGVLVLLLLAAILSRKRCPKCKHWNARRAEHCIKCHHRLR